MKKVFVICVLGCAFCLTASSQKLKETQVPANVRAAFQKEYPNLSATWEKEKGNYEVNFKKNAKSMSALINNAGTIIEEEMDISINELPQTATSYVNVHYKGQKIKEIAKITNDKGETTYEVEIKGMELIFDNQGKLIRQQKKEGD